MRLEGLIKEQAKDPFAPIGIACFLFTFLFAVRHISLHFQHFSNPVLQKLYCRIIFVPVVYAFCSMMVLCVGVWATVLDPVRDGCEAYMLFCFVCAILEYGGGESNVAIYLDSDDKKRLKIESKRFVNTLCCCVCGQYANGVAFIKYVYICLWQFLFFKPAFAAILAAFEIKDHESHLSDKEKKIDWIFRGLTVGTLLIVLVALFALYRTTHDLVKSQNVLGKFLAVKGLVAITIIQRIILEAAVSRHKLHSKDGLTPEDRSIRIQHVLICLEMVVFSFIFYHYFSYTDFMQPYQQPKELNQIENNKNNNNNTNENGNTTTNGNANANGKSTSSFTTIQKVGMILTCWDVVFRRKGKHIIPIV